MFNVRTPDGRRGFRDCAGGGAGGLLRVFTAMAFNLKLVLKALLFSSSQPLTIKDIQTVFTRYHDQAAAATAGARGEETEGGEATEVPVNEETAAASGPGRASSHMARPARSGRW